MATLTRKKQQILDREHELLAVARKLIVEDGYHGLSMDRIAESMLISKGTVYNHFECKEEIIIALAAQTLKLRAELFQKAALFRGRSRERITAVIRANEYFFDSAPDHFQFEQMLKIESIWEKTSEKRRNNIRSSEMRCMAVVSGIVRDAIASGELKLPESEEPEDVVFGLWSLAFGGQSIMASSSSLEELGVSDPSTSLRNQLQRILDGYRWQPLSEKLRMPELLRRIDREVLEHE